jgi:4-oxalocrotonate tautomerase
VATPTKAAYYTCKLSSHHTGAHTLFIFDYQRVSQVFMYTQNTTVSMLPFSFVSYHFLLNFIFDFLSIFNMPIITVAMYSGRTQRDKDRLAEAITEDIVNILKVEKKEVIIVFQEASHGNWYGSGVRL